MRHCLGSLIWYRGQQVPRRGSACLPTSPGTGVPRRPEILSEVRRGCVPGSIRRRPVWGDLTPTAPQKPSGRRRGSGAPRRRPRVTRVTVRSPGPCLVVGAALSGDTRWGGDPQPGLFPVSAAGSPCAARPASASRRWATGRAHAVVPSRLARATRPESRTRARPGGGPRHPLPSQARLAGPGIPGQAG